MVLTMHEEVNLLSCGKKKNIFSIVVNRQIISYISVKKPIVHLAQKRQLKPKLF